MKQKEKESYIQAMLYVAKIDGRKYRAEDPAFIKRAV